MSAKKLLVIGASAVSSLEKSYVRSAESLGLTVRHFDPEKETQKYIKGGVIGTKIHQFFPVDSWVRKMNRELIISVRDFQPEIILVFTNVKLLYGTIATIKTICKSKIVWIWPDTPMNLSPINLEAAGLYDLSAIYSSEAIPVFKIIGFTNPAWVPLAGDPTLHGRAPKTDNRFNCDISFVGMWRPEREKALVHVHKSFPDLKMEIYGTYWKDRCGSSNLKRFVKGAGIVGKELGNYFNNSRINLNVIDDTNYPAANMRFFEISTAGGLQLTSSCPEQESIFRNRKEVLYFKNETELSEQIEWVINNPESASQIRIAANRLLLSEHTYTHRLSKILSIV